MKSMIAWKGIRIIFVLCFISFLVFQILSFRQISGDLTSYHTSSVTVSDHDTNITGIKIPEILYDSGVKYDKNSNNNNNLEVFFGKKKEDDDDNKINNDGNRFYPTTQQASTAQTMLPAEEVASYYDSIRQRFIDENRRDDFHWRGIGYLYSKFNLMLTVILPTQEELQNSLPGQEQYIRIVDANNQHPTNCNPELVSMWVRIAGKEIISGSALPVTATTIDADNDSGEHIQKCEWYFPFRLHIAGKYRVEVKLLNYNGYEDFNTANCHIIQAKGKAEIMPYKDLQSFFPNNYGIWGFKFYSADTSCCEICTRTSSCEYWTTPSYTGPSPDDNPWQCHVFLSSPSNTTTITQEQQPNKNAYDHSENNMSLRKLLRRRLHEDDENKHRDIYSVNGDWYSYPLLSTTNQRNYDDSLSSSLNLEQQQRQQNRISRRRRVELQKIDKPAYGTSRKESTAYFMGCGWSYWLSLSHPCVKGDEDMLHGSNQFIEVGSTAPDDAIDSSIGDHGNKKNSNNSNSNKWEANAAKYFLDATTMLPLCRIKDETLQSTTTDNSKNNNYNKGRWIRLPFPTDCTSGMHIDEKYSDIYPKEKFIANKPHCWHRENISRLGTTCMEMECTKVLDRQWKSWLHSEKRFYGFWTPYNCKYLEYTTNELQQCFIDKKINQINVEGESIAHFIKEYLDQRLENIAFHKSNNNDDDDNEGISILFSSLALPHKVWRNNVTEYTNYLHTIPKATSKQHKYFVSGFYYSSEREEHILLERSLQYSLLAEEILGKKEHKVINAFDMTAAFTYDTAGQFDGLHIAGPPMKMIVNKLFHHICAY